MDSSDFIDQAAIAAMAAILQNEALYKQCKLDKMELPMCSIHDVVADKARRYAEALADALNKKT